MNTINSFNPSPMHSIYPSILKKLSELPLAQVASRSFRIAKKDLHKLHLRGASLMVICNQGVVGERIYKIMKNDGFETLKGCQHGIFANKTLNQVLNARMHTQIAKDVQALVAYHHAKKAGGADQEFADIYRAVTKEDLTKEDLKFLAKLYGRQNFEKFVREAKIALHDVQSSEALAKLAQENEELKVTLQVITGALEIVGTQHLKEQTASDALVSAIQRTFGSSDTEAYKESSNFNNTGETTELYCEDI